MIQEDATIGLASIPKQLEKVVRDTLWHESVLRVAKTLVASVYNAMYLYVTPSTIMGQKLLMVETVFINMSKPNQKGHPSENSRPFR